MVWTISYTDTSLKQLRKLDEQTARRIVDYMEKRVATRNHPQDLGKALTGPLGGFWRYRAGSYRIVVDIEDDLLNVLVLHVGHRRDVYRDIP